MSDKSKAAADKYKTAAKDMKNATNDKDWHEASDRLIDAQHEGAPKRFRFGAR